MRARASGKTITSAAPQQIARKDSVHSDVVLPIGGISKCNVDMTFMCLSNLSRCSCRSRRMSSSKKGEREQGGSKLLLSHRLVHLISFSVDAALRNTLFKALRPADELTMAKMS